MKKKKQTKLKDSRAEKSQRGRVTMPADDAWERLMKIREKLRKAAPHNEVMGRLERIGEEIGKGWQSEKSAVEILSEMRR